MRILHVVLLEHLIKAHLIEPAVEVLGMLVEDVFLNEVRGLETFVAEHATVNGSLCHFLCLLLSILSLALDE